MKLKNWTYSILFINIFSIILTSSLGSDGVENLELVKQADRFNLQNIADLIQFKELETRRTTRIRTEAEALAHKRWGGGASFSIRTPSIPKPPPVQVQVRAPPVQVQSSNKGVSLNIGGKPATSPGPNFQAKAGPVSLQASNKGASLNLNFGGKPAPSIGSNFQAKAGPASLKASDKGASLNLNFGQMGKSLNSIPKFQAKAGPASLQASNEGVSLNFGNDGKSDAGLKPNQHSQIPTALKRALIITSKGNSIDDAGQRGAEGKPTAKQTPKTPRINPTKSLPIVKNVKPQIINTEQRDAPPKMEKKLSEGTQKKEGFETFKLHKKSIQKLVDSKYTLMALQDNYMNSDHTIRFLSTDTTNGEVYSLKFYFKGNPKKGEFYSQLNDLQFKSAIEDCRNTRIILNRLYKRPMNADQPLTQLEHPIYPNVRLPECYTRTDSGNLRTLWTNVLSLPKGVSLEKRCLKGKKLNKDNSCIPYLRLIADSVVKAIKIFNSGDVFFKHGNISPSSIFLSQTNSTDNIFVDNMLFDNNKYDDVTNKPFKGDFNILGDLLISLIAGTSKKVVKEPILDPFDLYYQIKNYYRDNRLEINLDTSALNLGNLKFREGKRPTRTEVNYRLGKSIFNFIYRLKCTSFSKLDQFIDIDQALNHEFLKSGKKKILDDNWDTLPADY